MDISIHELDQECSIAKRKRVIKVWEKCTKNKLKIWYVWLRLIIYLKSSWRSWTFVEKENIKHSSRVFKYSLRWTAASFIKGQVDNLFNRPPSSCSSSIVRACFSPLVCAHLNCCNWSLFVNIDIVFLMIYVNMSLCIFTMLYFLILFVHKISSHAKASFISSTFPTCFIVNKNLINKYKQKGKKLVMD